MKKMKQLFYLIIITLVLGSCGKDKFDTKPKLKFVKVNSNTINRNDDLKIELNVTDLEGDLTDSIFVMRRVRNCAFGNRDEKYAMPVFPVKKNLNVDILVAYTYGTGGVYPGLPGPSCGGRNDSCVFRFVVKDKAGNLSDTATTNEIVIKQ